MLTESTFTFLVVHQIAGDIAQAVVVPTHADGVQFQATLVSLAVVDAQVRAAGGLAVPPLPMPGIDSPVRRTNTTPRAAPLQTRAAITIAHLQRVFFSLGDKPATMNGLNIDQPGKFWHIQP